MQYVKASKDFDMNNELQEYEQAHPEQMQNGVFEVSRTLFANNRQLIFTLCADGIPWRFRYWDEKEEEDG